MKKILLNTLPGSISESYDWFVCSASFESRSLSVPTAVSNINIRYCTIFKNHDLAEYVDENFEKIYQIYRDIANVGFLSTVDSIKTADSIMESINTITRKISIKSILLDITSFTHESLLIFMRVIYDKFRDVSVTCVYNGAKEYSVGDEVSNKWLSRGVGDIRSVLGYPGNIMPSKKNHLILIVGYEYERAMSLIEQLEPHSISLGYGKDDRATTDKNREANEWYMHLVDQMASIYTNIIKFDIPCDDICEAKNGITRQIDFVIEKNMNAIIAPMNNKITTMAAAFAQYEREMAQICYAKPLSYNYLNYSLPSDSCYFFELWGQYKSCLKK
jgi:hypothetical protein